MLLRVGSGQSTFAETIDSDPSVIPARSVLASARAFQLTAYEAVYLDLARREHLPLTTLDKGLRTAAEKAGVELLR